MVDYPVGLRSSATSFKGSFSAVLNRNLKRNVGGRTATVVDVMGCELINCQLPYFVKNMMQP